MAAYIASNTPSMFAVRSFVPETHDAIAFGFKPTSPRVVASPNVVVTVLRAVHFNDQAGGHTGEVGDIRSDRHLTAKMRTRYREPAKPAPQQIFRAGYFVSQLFGGAS